MAMKENLFKRLFFSERLPFSEKRDINWKAVKWSLISLLLGFVVVVLLIPSEPEPTPETNGSTPQASSPPQTPNHDSMPNARELSAYYQGSQATSHAPSRQGPMILSRQGLDYRTQLPPGARIKVRLLQSSIVSTEAMPITAMVIEDVPTESGLAIERGSKLFGEASFDDTGDVASVVWTALQSDGRERPISAIGVSLSGHVGVLGKVHSKRGQNVAGQMISRFVGAYAEGSMTRGVLGHSQGGAENGLKSAVAATAKDQADSYANDLKREKRWIELEAGSESLAVLKQPFSFKDPGNYAK